MVEDRMLGAQEGELLQAIAEQEFSGPDRGRRFSTGQRPNEFDLIPRIIRTKGGGVGNRFLQLEVADPLRTEVLCYLTTRDTLLWLEQHYPTDWREQANRRDASGIAVNYREASRVDYVAEALSRTTAERELQCLMSRHRDQQARIEELLSSIQHDEVVAFRKALQLDLWEYPNRS